MSDERTEARVEAAAAKARAKALRPWYRKKRFLLPLALVVLIGIAMASSGGEDEPEKIGSTGTTEPADDATTTTTAAPNNGPFKVGDIVRRGDLEAAVLSVNADYAPNNDYIRPDAGNKFVGVELQVKNTGTESETLSTLLQFKLRDASNAQYDIDVFGVPDPRFPDGELAAGDTNRGWIGFEVPDDAGGLKFVFDADVFGEGRITWEL